LAQSLWPHMSAAGAFFPTAPHEADAIIAAWSVRLARTPRMVAAINGGPQCVVPPPKP
jgi:hypothetical protein